jgi:hypothetical protein
MNWHIYLFILQPCCEAKYTGRKEHVVEEVKKNSKVVVFFTFLQRGKDKLYWQNFFLNRLSEEIPLCMNISRCEET